MQDPEELDSDPVDSEKCLMTLRCYKSSMFNYRVAHFKSSKALRLLLHIFPNRDTNNTKLSTIAKEAVLLLHCQRC